VDIAPDIDMVYGPLVDAKKIPAHVDVFLVSGSVSTNEEIEKVRNIRESSEIVASFGDCAVTGNVPSMRNWKGADGALEHAYRETADDPDSPIPGQDIPVLLKRCRPVHEVIEVDEFIQGCPPDADLIHLVLGELLEGRTPRRGIRTKFG
ncbi:MAG: NADP oxidoreductase, partial [Planctomycetota bacterium]